MKKSTAKRALFLSVLSLLMCVSMLVGTTFAWFTDSVTSGVNQILAGNLDVELAYSTDMTTWSTVDIGTNIFNDETRWEPGHTEVVYLRVSNAGTLALKYNLGIHVADETIGKTMDGQDIKLSNYIEYGVIEDITTPYGADDRMTARADIGAAAPLNTAYKKEFVLAGKTETATDADIFALVVYMPEAVGNQANHNGTDIPSIHLGLSVLATQNTVESDSFDNQYDASASTPWDGVSLEEPAKVDGVYQVGKPAELAWLAASNSPIDHACLTANIDMMGATISSIDIYSYRTFNGNGYKISNVIVDGSGLFGNIESDCTIKDLTLDQVTVNTASGDYAGIVNGKFSGKYENITVLNSTVNAPNSEYVGGLAGAVYKNIVNCKVENISVTGTEKVGGLVGFFTLADIGYSIKLENCSAKNVTVTATNPAKPYAGVFFGRGLATSSYKFIFVNCSAALKDGQKLIGQDYYNNINTNDIAVTTLP